jgi:hypothetical protein
VSRSILASQATAEAEASRCQRLFWCWLTGRTAVWTAVTLLSRPNAPLDLIEWLAWGHQFSWGYPKHPPLPAWLAAAFAQFSPGDVWPVYLLSYFLVAICLWSVWQLGRDFLPPRLALAACMCLDGLLYLTRDPAEFSNNITLDVAWALTILCFVRAVRSGKLGWWVGLGAVAGLGLLSKYTLGILLVVLASFLIYDREARAHLRRPGPYLAALLALALFAPHAVWLVQHDFITLEYAAERSHARAWAAHLFNPAAFAIGQLVRLTPMLLILVPLLRARPDQPTARCPALDWAVVGPVVLLLTLSLVTGRQVRDIWGSPLWILAGVWLLAKAGSASPAGLRWSGRVWAVVASVLVMGCVVQNVAGPYVLGQPTRTHYPGRLLANEVTRRWQARCAAPLPIVAGEPWRAGNVCCYCAHQPIIYSSGSIGYFVFEPRHSPWTDDADLATRGGVLLWDATQLGDALPADAAARFQTAEVQPPIVLPYQTGAAIPPDRVGVALIWPK